MDIPRILLAAGASGSGKTLITCGLLQALVNRKMKVASFKCGPDYIDPMFHSRVIGTKSRNLDTFFTDAQTTRYLLGKNHAFDMTVLFVLHKTFNISCQGNTHPSAVYHKDDRSTKRTVKSKA